MVLEFDTVKKSYRDSEGIVPVLRGISFGIEPGQTLALTGESGSGKSTVLHIAGGLEAPDAGGVFVAGNNLASMDDGALAEMRRTEIALVFQQFNLIPSLTVAANISFQAALSGRLNEAYINQLVDSLGLTEHLHKFPEVLSGGQQQRVAIARALAAKPKILLADEPTGNLDETTADDVLEQMLDLVAQTGAALMVVTHSSKIAARMDREIHLHGGVLE
ncbi:MAG: ABC transporter ATP-binding protein [Pseudomonadota bacterium]